MSQNLTGLVSGREDVRREERAANPWKLQVLLELKEYASGHRLILRLHSASTHLRAPEVWMLSSCGSPCDRSVELQLLGCLQRAVAFETAVSHAR